MKIWLSKPPPGVQLNKGSPLAQGLVACWLLNEGSGLRANDLSGNNNHGTLTNFEPFSATSKWTGGQNGTALQFDGTNDQITIPNSPSLSISPNITILATINTTNINPGYAQRIIAKAVDAANRSYDFFIQTNGTLFLGINNAGGGVSSTGAITSNAWFTVAVVFNDDANTTTFYINGAQDSVTVQNASIQQQNTNILIGNFDGLARNFIGRIDNVMIWNRALSSIEVQQVTSKHFPMFLMRGL